MPYDKRLIQHTLFVHLKSQFWDARKPLTTHAPAEKDTICWACHGCSTRVRWFKDFINEHGQRDPLIKADGHLKKHVSVEKQFRQAFSSNRYPRKEN